MKGFFKCSICSKKILRRLPNGLWSFAFGKFSGKDVIILNEKEISIGPVVQIEIYGSLRMKCLRRECRKKHPDHWNILNYFPNPKEEVDLQST